MTHLKVAGLRAWRGNRSGTFHVEGYVWPMSACGKVENTDIRPTAKDKFCGMCRKVVESY